MSKSGSLERWSIENAVDLYGVHNWGAGYFDISDQGEVVVNPSGIMGDKNAVSLMKIVSDIKDRGMGMPILLRFRDILQSQITSLHKYFQDTITELGYQNKYRGVYPIKVNQQQQVVEEVTQFGSRFHHGLEAGSKAELIAAISLLRDPEACLVCNGYKSTYAAPALCCALVAGRLSRQRILLWSATTGHVSAAPVYQVLASFRFE